MLSMFLFYMYLHVISLYLNVFICYSRLFKCMVTDRVMGKKNQLRQAAPASDFSIIGFFPIRVQNIPEVIRTFFSP